MKSNYLGSGRIGTVSGCMQTPPSAPGGVMASKKAASWKAVNKKSVGKKILHMADRCRSRCRSRNGAALQYHTTLSEELSAMANEEQLRRASWYWGTVHCLNELEHEGLL